MATVATEIGLTLSNEDPLASLRPMALLLSERLMAQVLHFNGQHREARVLAQQVLQQAGKAIGLAHTNP
jgi:hypothetical protein